jgi:malate permease and related proteins
MQILNTLMPIYLLIGLGLLLRRYRSLSEGFFAEAIKLTFWVGLPALLLRNIARAEMDLAASWRISLVMIAASIGAALIGVLLARLLGLPLDSRKTFVHTCFHCNTAFVGLPVVMYAFEGTVGGEGTISLASLSIAPLIPVTTVMAILATTGQGGGALLRLQFLKRLAKNPLVLACLGGLLIAVSGVRLPAMFDRGLAALGRMAMPLALLGIGATQIGRAHV